MRVFFSMPSPKIIALFTVLPFAVRLWVGGVSLWDPVIVVGVVFAWGLQEHQAHKYLLHKKPFKLFGRTWDLYMARVHRAHHREPWKLKMILSASLKRSCVWPRCRYGCSVWEQR